MGFNKILSTKISDLLLEQSSIEEPSEITKSVDQYLLLSERMLKELSSIRINESSKSESTTNDQDIYSFEKEYSVDIQQIEAIISSSEESGIHDQSNYRKLQHNYYQIINAILTCKSVNFTKTMKVVEEKLSLLDIKSKTIEEKFEGIGSTILSTVVSLTVVVTAITAIEKISAIYIPLYLVSMVWLCMTLIVFINNLFNKKEFNSKQAVFLYGIISLLVCIVLVGTLFYIKSNNIDILNYIPKKEQVSE